MHDPAMTKILVNMILLRLPIAIIGPPNKAPKADPKIVKVWIRLYF